MALLTVGVLGPSEGEAQAAALRILAYSETAGFRHRSIADAIAAIEELGAEHDFAVDKTEDSNAFTDSNLAQYDAVAFVMTTGNVLDPDQQAAFKRFIRAGGGFVGVHSASDTEYDWPWYGDLVGAYFDSHPPTQNATVRIEDNTHASTESLPLTWPRRDEWYNFDANPRSQVNVLANVDESTYSGGSMGDHPISWYHEYDGGRAWYTGMGHTEESYAEADFRSHILGGILYAADRDGGVIIDPTLPMPKRFSVAQGTRRLDAIMFD